MPRPPDTSIIGSIYNNLHVDSLTDKRNSYDALLYQCTCLLCGKERLATKSNLLRGEIKDCGYHKPHKDLSNLRFNKLTALYVTDLKSTYKSRCRIWHCMCECGNECDVLSSDLLSGNVKSCGCLHGEHVKSLHVDGTEPCKLTTTKLRSTNTSGHTGVSYDKGREMWVAEITFRRKKHFLGRYSKLADAVAARKAGEDKYFKSFLEQHGLNKE